MEPLPITISLVQAIASSLKNGRYRSSAQIFSMARQQHVAHTGQRLGADIEQEVHPQHREGPRPLHAQGCLHRRGPRSHRRRRHSTGDNDRTLGRLRLRLRPRDHHLLLVDVTGHRGSSSQVLTRVVRNDHLWQNGILHLTVPQDRHRWNVHHQVTPMHVLRQLGSPLPLSCLGNIHEPQSHPEHRQER